MALTPVAPLPQSPALSPAVSTSLAVNLAASIDPITPWIDTFQASADNIGGLFNAWAATPFPILQQVVANQLTYIGELPDIVTIVGQVIGNIGNALEAPFVADTSTLDEPHQLIWSLLPQVAPDLQGPLIDFTTSSLSGVLIGLVGPVVAPVLALVNSVGSIIEALGKSDFLGALNDLINIPANLTNAFLNGGPTLDLTGLVSALGVQLPSLIKSIGLTMGGVLSQGGSIFNSLDVVAQLAPGFNVPIPGVPAGTIGSVIGLTNAIADAIKVVPPTVEVAQAAASEAPAEPESAPVAIEATSAAAPQEAVALSAEPEADAVPADAVTLEATVEEPTAAPGDNATKRGRDGGIRAGRGAAPAAAATTDNAPKQSSGKGHASRG